MKIGSSFHINANNDVNAQSLTAELVELDEETWKQAELPAFEQESQFTSAGLSLRWLGEHSKEEFSAMPITDRGGLSLDLLRSADRTEGQRQPVAFVTTRPDFDEVVFLLSRVILNTGGLAPTRPRIIEPDIERIDPVASLELLRLWSQCEPGRRSN